MNIAFCLFLTEDEYERSINSLQLDESLMAVLAGVTGDVVFRTWRPRHPMVSIEIARDVPREVYWHAVIDEYAHGRLRQMAEEAKRIDAGEPMSQRTPVGVNQQR